MRFPKLRPTQQTMQTQSVFGGYNHNPRIGDGEFYDICNLSSDSYPLLTPRSKRGVLTLTDTAQGRIRGIAVNNGLCYVKGSCIVLPGGKAVDLGLTEGEKQLVTMGAYVIILPDKKWINTACDGQYGAIECSYVASQMEMWICRQDGTPIVLYGSLIKTDYPDDGDYWVDDTGETPVMKRWDENLGLWQEETCYLRLHFDEGPEFRKGDTLLGPEIRATYYAPEKYEQFMYIPKDPVVLEVVDGDPVVVGCATCGFSLLSCTVQTAVNWHCSMPDMDYVIESGNRLWGCKFGQTEAGFVNEIYASGLGDFRKWESFQGISTDSYRVSVGADGPFTGAVNYLGRPLFFKENCLLRIYGDQPANFRVQDTPCQGVQQGCAGSLAVVENMLFYKSWAGVCGYDGSVPVSVGEALGDQRCTAAVAGSLGQKYYLSMTTQGGKELFVYDVGKRIWHREDDPGAVAFATGENTLYCLPAAGDRILRMNGGPEPGADAVSWMAQTGPLGLTTPEAKYISRLLLRLSLEPEATARVSVRYDSSPAWEHLYTLKGSRLRSFTIPIRPKRCDHMQLRLEGTGQMQLFSMSRVWEEGSDL